jgi:hypothetical protein
MENVARKLRTPGRAQGRGRSRRVDVETVGSRRPGSHAEDVTHLKREQKRVQGTAPILRAMGGTEEGKPGGEDNPGQGKPRRAEGRL